MSCPGCWMGWMSQHIPGKWAELVLLLADPCSSRFSFPCFFLIIPFFSPPRGAQSCLCLGVDTPGMLVVAEKCKDSLTHHQGSLFPGFSLCCPPSSHSLYDHSPLTAASSSSVSISSQCLSLPKDLSETEGGFNLLENSDFCCFLLLCIQ